MATESVIMQGEATDLAHIALRERIKVAQHKWKLIDTVIAELCGPMGWETAEAEQPQNLRRWMGKQMPISIAGADGKKGFTSVVLPRTLWDKLSQEQQQALEQTVTDYVETNVTAYREMRSRIKKFMNECAEQCPELEADPAEVQGAKENPNARITFTYHWKRPLKETSRVFNERVAGYQRSLENIVQELLVTQGSPQTEGPQIVCQKNNLTTEPESCERVMTVVMTQGQLDAMITSQEARAKLLQAFTSINDPYGKMHRMVANGREKIDPDQKAPPQPHKRWHGMGNPVQPAFSRISHAMAEGVLSAPTHQQER